MPLRNYFKAPWGRQLKWTTALTALLLLGIPVLVLSRAPEARSAWASGLVLLPPAILIVSALFNIRGYQVLGRELLVYRSAWKTRVPLADLQSAEEDPQAMLGAVRLFGNSGLFSISGLFQSNRLGRFRAFATDPEKSVVLRFPGHTLVVTPDNPQKFVASLGLPPR